MESKCSLDKLLAIISGVYGGRCFVLMPGIVQAVTPTFRRDGICVVITAERHITHNKRSCTPH